MQLAHALATNEDCAGREAADFYRQQYPDVDVSRVTYAPSRSQYRWRSRSDECLAKLVAERG
jgi:hypothetical protein